VAFKPESRLPPLKQFFAPAEALEEILGRPVDLVEPQVVENPFILAGRAERPKTYSSKYYRIQFFGHT
jgi:predicted nucleotidyltransferase